MQMQDINSEWKDMFFVGGVLSVDLDGDKLHYCSRLWPTYGMERTPTKSKKLQLVIHITCTTGSGHICNMTTDTLNHFPPLCI